MSAGQCPVSNSMGRVVGPVIPVIGFHAAAPARRGFGIRRVMTVIASASSILARCAEAVVDAATEGQHISA